MTTTTINATQQQNEIQDQTTTTPINAMQQQKEIQDQINKLKLRLRDINNEVLIEEHKDHPDKKCPRCHVIKPYSAFIKNKVCSRKKALSLCDTCRHKRSIYEKSLRAKKKAITN